LIGKIINFVILFGGLAFVLYKPFLNFLRKRSEDIRTAISEAGDARREAEQKLEEARRKIGVLEEEVARIKKEAELEGLKEKDTIKILAEKEAERIKFFARQEIEMHFKAGIRELKEFAAELATSLAEARIKKRVTDQDQSALIDKSIERLAKLYEKRSSG